MKHFHVKETDAFDFAGGGKFFDDVEKLEEPKKLGVNFYKHDFMTKH